MSTVESPPSQYTSAAAAPSFSPAPSQFLLNLASPSVAALHNTSLKLKDLLEHPELAESARAELCPAGFTLGDLFNMFAWANADRCWKGLGFGAKESTLYSLHSFF